MAAGIQEIKKILKENNAEHISVIAKIENAEGVEILMRSSQLLTELWWPEETWEWKSLPGSASYPEDHYQEM